MLTVLVHANYKTLLGKGRDHILNRRLHFLNHHKTGHQGFLPILLVNISFMNLIAGSL